MEMNKVWKNLLQKSRRSVSVGCIPVMERRNVMIQASDAYVITIQIYEFIEYGKVKFANQITSSNQALLIMQRGWLLCCCAEKNTCIG
jgi:hypothetical protein